MLIIWGWRTIRTVLTRGRFFCPQCRGDSDYRRLALRRWFTVFFIPLIPLARQGTCVECTQCRTTFTDLVLDSTTAEVFAHHLGLANRAVVAHLVSCSPPADDRTLAVGRQALAAAPGVGPGYDASALAADVAFFADLDVVRAYLRPLAAEMTIEGREDFLRRMHLLAVQLPHGTARVHAVTESVAEALAVSPAHLAGIRQLAESGVPAAGGQQ